MTTHEILQTLQVFQRSHADEFGIIRLGLFGSATYNAEREDSDIDVVVEIADPDMFTLIGIQQELELCLHRSVDLIRYRPSMNAFLKKRIDQEAIYV